MSTSETKKRKLETVEAPGPELKKEEEEMVAVQLIMSFGNYATEPCGKVILIPASKVKKIKHLTYEDFRSGEITMDCYCDDEQTKDIKNLNKMLKKGVAKMYKTLYVHADSENRKIADVFDVRYE